MIKFKPIVKTLVWGTETWLISGVSQNESVVAEGPLAGKTLNEVWNKEFPLLIKLIDARKDLSIQVHPGDELAAKRHGCKGKTEMWYVTGADDGAHLMSGLNREITPDEYERRIRNNSITEVLSSYEVKEGDVFFLPAGRIHAIGAGYRIAEIQQTSDITYRIYDYNRPGLDGKPRQLHIEESKDAVDYSVCEDYRTAYTACKDKESLLVECPFFKTGLLELTKDFSRPVESEFLIVICLDGEVTVDGCSLSAGEAGLAVREAKMEIRPVNGDAKLLLVE